MTAYRMALGLVVLGSLAAVPAFAEEEEQAAEPIYLKDRGTGVATSMFGTYIRRGELIVYPYWEYYLDNDREYTPQDLGFAGAQDFRGRYRASEGLFFLAYGLTQDLAVQVEGTVIRASLEKSPADLSALPARLEQSGFGDREVQLRWRWGVRHQVGVRRVRGRIPEAGLALLALLRRRPGGGGRGHSDHRGTVAPDPPRVPPVQPGGRTDPERDRLGAAARHPVHPADSLSPCQVLPPARPTPFATESAPEAATPGPWAGGSATSGSSTSWAISS